MALSDEQIRANLVRFAADWGNYAGSEKAEAQTFLNELLAAFGTDRKQVAEFEPFVPGAGFFDMLWPGVCLWEMKAPSEAEHLDRHRVQAVGQYWPQTARLDEGIPAAEYVVLCAFKQFEIWQPGRFPGAPRAAFGIEELPDRLSALRFLIDEEPLFEENKAAVTIDAVRKLAALHESLTERAESRPDERHLFILQCVWCMFAEDFGQLEGSAFARIVHDLIENPRRSSADDLGGLFAQLNDPAPDRPTHGLYRGVPYANGQLFAQPARVHLNPDELRLLQQANRANWTEVQPAIFGNLLQDVLGPEKQWRLGAHYTHETEIYKVVGPTIVDPWLDRITALGSYDEALRAQADLLSYVVLDPACGSGNFLYVAYRELRRIESMLAEQVAELARGEGRPHEPALAAFFPLTNMKGIETEAFAVELARVTLWMGHRLAVEELGLSERTLPLADLSGIRRADALRVEWPRANAIIGNPPYHGSQNLRALYDQDYLDWLERRFHCGLKDLCVYWFRRAADEMQPGDRAGLVGTNSISQNRARGASLNYVVERGGVITEAVSRQKWPGEAVVNVSIVNWVKQPDPPPDRFVLDGERVAGISTRLRESLQPIEEYERLEVNAARSFQGPIPAGRFYLDPEEAEALLARTEADYSEVVRPYLIGDDITEDPGQRPRRWIVDFGFRPLEEATRWPAALEIVRQRVKPARDRNRDEGFRRYWWRFGRPRGEMRDALAPLSRYIAGNRVGKRFLYCWAEPATCPSDLTVVFAFEDDYAMGILTSSAHQVWARAESSTLRVDLRYTPTTCFETFPWPQPTAVQRADIGRIAAALIAERQSVCRERGIGLTDFYNLLDDGGFREIGDLHRQLDRAVAAAYGWPASITAEPLQIRSRLAELNRAIVAGELDYDPFPAPPE